MVLQRKGKGMQGKLMDVSKNQCMQELFAASMYCCQAPVRMGVCSQVVGATYGMENDPQLGAPKQPSELPCDAHVLGDEVEW